MIDIELFAGAGGMAVGLKAAGFFPASMFERDEHSCATLKANLESDTPTLEGEVNEGNVEKAKWSKIDQEVRLLAAGAPCQPFSLGGKHNAERDGRNLFPEVLRAVRTLQPRAVFIENVRGLVRPSFRQYFDYIIRQLECPSFAPRSSEGWMDHDARLRAHQVSLGYVPGYRVEYRFYDAADFGVPQHRCRVFIVATRRGLLPFEFPEPTHSREALLRAKRSGEFWERHKVPKAKREILAADDTDPVAPDGKLPWVTVRDALADLPKAAKSESTAWMNHWLIAGARSYSGHTGSDLNWPSKTIKAGVHGVPGGENTLVDDHGVFRYYTLREAARIQSFGANTGCSALN